MSARLFVLDWDGRPRPCFDTAAWAAWMREQGEACVLHTDRVGEATIRTAFVGVIDEDDEGRPLLWETHATGPASRGRRIRTTSAGLADLTHRVIVDELRAETRSLDGDGVAAPAPDARRCPACREGTLRAMASTGRSLYLGDRAVLPVPDALVAPTCTRCRAVWLSDEPADAIDAIERLVREKLCEVAARAVELAVLLHGGEAEVEARLAQPPGTLRAILAGGSEPDLAVLSGLLRLVNEALQAPAGPRPRPPRPFPQ